MTTESVAVLLSASLAVTVRVVVAVGKVMPVMLQLEVPVILPPLPPDKLMAVTAGVSLATPFKLIGELDA